MTDLPLLLPGHLAGLRRKVGASPHGAVAADARGPAAAPWTQPWPRPRAGRVMILKQQQQCESSCSS